MKYLLQTMMNKHASSSDVSGIDLKTLTIFAMYYGTQYTVSKHCWISYSVWNRKSVFKIKKPRTLLHYSILSFGEAGAMSYQSFLPFWRRGSPCLWLLEMPNTADHVCTLDLWCLYSHLCNLISILAEHCCCLACIHPAHL